LNVENIDPIRHARTDYRMHVGRSWSGHPLEDACPCIKEPCGLVGEGAKAECDQHGGVISARTMRQLHWADECPGGGQP